MQKAHQTFELNSHVCLEPLSEIDKKKFQGLKTEEKALLLINAASADSPKVISDLKNIEGIIEVYPLKGMYDVAAVAHAESFEKLKEMVFIRIKLVPNIKATLTLTLIEERTVAE